jgi:predicted HAD superfamily Cof-like phosphohydrolase
MYNPQRDVSKFMRACDQEVKESPGIPDDSVMSLRCKLILEEAFEFVEAAGYEVKLSTADQERIHIDRQWLILNKNGPPNIPEMAKELADINVVTYGAGNAIGIDLSSVFKEVQKSNMTKIGPDGKVIKNHAGKVQKSANYKPANIERVLTKQGWAKERYDSRE